MKNNNIIIYASKDGNVKVDVSVINEDIWMSQEVMANLYDTTKNNISMHLKNVPKSSADCVSSSCHRTGMPLGGAWSDWMIMPCSRMQAEIAARSDSDVQVGETAENPAFFNRGITCSIGRSYFACKEKPSSITEAP